MSIVRNNTVIMWKGFPFPMSIESFKMSEDAKVATYEYAGRNGAEQERVLAYRVFTISGLFTSDSGPESPSYYAQKLRQLNDNEPGVLAHPVFGTYRCICKSLNITSDGTELEHSPGIDGSGNYLSVSGLNLSGGGGVAMRKNTSSITVEEDKRAIPNYRFELTFWESVPPNAASLQSQLEKLFPATSVKPTSDNYKTSNKYKTVTQLYWALVNGQISAGLDPIRNAEWLGYDYTFRKQAYDMWIADPKGTNQSKTKTGSKLSTSTSQNVYTVTTGDTTLKVAKKLNTTPEKLYNVNKGKKVRDPGIRVITQSDNNVVPPGAYWDKPSNIFPGDTLFIPNTASDIIGTSSI